MQETVRFTRTIVAVLVLTLLWNGFARAAKPSHKLAMLQAAMQAAVQGSGTIPAPATAVSTPPPTDAMQPLGARERMRLAHTILVSRTGNDPYFALPESDTYNTVLNALNQWGRYRIVTDAAQADLVVQLHGVAIASTAAGTPQDPAGSVTYSSVLRITVADPHTLAPIWEVNVPVAAALREKTREHNTALTGEVAVSQLKLLAGDSLSKQEQAQLKESYNSHIGRIVWISAAGVALTLGLFFIARHAAQQNQASFCQQHNLSPCPGA